MKVTVTASQPSRWRAGRQFGSQPVEIEVVTPADALQAQAILADPTLAVSDRDALQAHVDQLLTDLLQFRPREELEPKPAKGKAKAD